MRLLYCFIAWAFIHLSNGVSTKMDFGGEESDIEFSNTTNVKGDDDVEVKHTIVVSTKLKNNNRRGVHSEDNGDKGTLNFNLGQKKLKTEDSGEVPVVPSYKNVDSTMIRTPDTRHRAKIYPDAIFVSRNIRDEYDNIYPNVAANPMQWRPSTFYNNINHGNDGRDSYNERKNRPVYQNTKLHRKITDDAMKEFYCKKCIEYSNSQGFKCSRIVQQRSAVANPWMYETTTSKMKIDGKLAKLN